MPSRSDRGVPRRRIADDAGVQVTFITSAGVNATGAIVVTTRGSATSRRFDPLPGVIGRQLTDSLLQHLHVHGGTWTSVSTLANQHGHATRALHHLEAEHGITDLTDRDLTPSAAWEAVVASSTASNRQRNFRTFLADTLAALRDDGAIHQGYLFARALPIEISRLEGYTPEVADTIEKVARQHVFDWYQRHRAAVQAAIGHLPKDWLWLPANELSNGHRTCPHPFRVTRTDLGAAMTLLALADDKGPNLSVIQSLTANSLERTSDDAAFVGAVKTRNKRVLRTPADAGSLFSYGGLIEFVTAATRVERATRDDGTDFGRLLFVATGDTEVMDAQWVRKWWGTTETDWPNPDIPRPSSISFPRLRKAAVLRGKKADRYVIGQSRRTRNLYLADALPDALLIPGLLDTQNSVTAYWRDDMTVRDEAAEEAAAVLQSNDVMDVGVAICSSNGQSPTDETKPCGLGPLACFVCTNGYRPPEVIPGLIAAVEFTDNIRAQSPQEWINGEGPTLNRLSRLALEQFPAEAVAAASREDIRNSRVLIACVYLEGRRRD